MTRRPPHAGARLSHRAKRLTRQRAQGFTLFEVIVALGILTIVAALAYGTFSRAMASRNQAEELATHYHEVRQAMLRMAREISMAFLSLHRDCKEHRTKTVFVEKNGRIDFASFSHYKIRVDANESDQNEISYFVDQTKKVLIRREQVRIDDDPQEGGLERVLAHNVEKLAFEFYDEKDEDWDPGWDSTSSMGERLRLPMFVKISLTVVNPLASKGEEETFVTKTRVFLRAPIMIAGTGFVPCPDY